MEALDASDEAVARYKCALRSSAAHASEVHSSHGNKNNNVNQSSSWSLPRLGTLTVAQRSLRFVPFAGKAVFMPLKDVSAVAATGTGQDSSITTTASTSSTASSSAAAAAGTMTGSQTQVGSGESKNSFLAGLASRWKERRGNQIVSNSASEEAEDSPVVGGLKRSGGDVASNPEADGRAGLRSSLGSSPVDSSSVAGYEARSSSASSSPRPQMSSRSDPTGSMGTTTLAAQDSTKHSSESSVDDAIDGTFVAPSPTTGLEADASYSSVSGVRVTMSSGTVHNFGPFLAGRSCAAEACSAIEHLWTRALQWRLASAQSEFESLQHFSQPKIFDTELHSSQWLESRSAGERGISLLKSVKEQRSFHALFRLPPVERVTAKFDAWIAVTGNYSLKGHLFVSDHFVAFFTRQDDHELAILTPYEHIHGLHYQVKSDFGGIKLRLELMPYDGSLPAAERKLQRETAKRRVRMFGLVANSTVICAELLSRAIRAARERASATLVNPPSTLPAVLAASAEPVEQPLISFDDLDEQPDAPAEPNLDELRVPASGLVVELPDESLPILPHNLAGVRWPDSMLSDERNFTAEFALGYAISRGEMERSAGYAPNNPAASSEADAAFDDESYSVNNDVDIAVPEPAADPAGARDGENSVSTTHVPSISALQPRAADESVLPDEGVIDSWKQYLRRYGSGISMVRFPEILSGLVHRGIPECLRGELWPVFCGAAAFRRVFPFGYYSNLLEAHLAETSTATDEVEKDLTRSFPEHPFFAAPEQVQTPRDGYRIDSSKCGEGVLSLRRVLVGYSWRNEKEVGYCQSMNIVCSFFLTYMREEETFWTMAVLCERLVPEYYHRSLVGSVVDYRIIADALMPEFLPRVSAHVQSFGSAADGMLALAIQPWLLCFFIGYVPYELVLRILDLVMYYDRDMLLCAAVALLAENEDGLVRVASPDEFLSFGKKRILCTRPTIERVVRKMISVYARLPRTRIAELRNKQKHAAIQNIESTNLKRTIRDMIKETRFSAEDAETLFKRFSAAQSLEVANYIEYDQFISVFGAVFPRRWEEISGLCDKVFETLDRQHRGRVDFKDFIVGLDPVLNGDLVERLQFCFNQFAKNGAATRAQLHLSLEAFLALTGSFTNREKTDGEDLAQKLHLFVNMIFDKYAQVDPELHQGTNEEREQTLRFDDLKALIIDVPLLVATFHLHEDHDFDGQSFSVI